MGEYFRPNFKHKNTVLLKLNTQITVLSRIYRLGEKSRVAEGDELPSGVRGHAPPEIL